MNARQILLFILLGTLLGTPVEKAKALEWNRCALDAGRGTEISAECTSLTVPENPAEPEGRSIDLNIAKVPARTADAEPDPIFFFAGLQVPRRASSVTGAHLTSCGLSPSTTSRWPGIGGVRGMRNQ